MKRIILISTILILFTGTANANLELLGQGTSAEGTWNLIYDEHLDVTWYDYTISDTWYNQMDWADGLSVDFGVNTYNNWRLPTTVDGIFELGYDGTTTGGWNITSSEMGHLWYTELGNKGSKDTAGNDQSGYGLLNTGDFQNLLPVSYLSSTEYSANPIYVWTFDFHWGDQDYDTFKTGSFRGIAVMEGKAIAPEPLSSALFIVGGATLGFRRFRKKFKQ